MTSEEVAAYLDRVGVPDRRHPDPASLRDLHHRHQCTVPFENLDIRRGVPLHLEPELLFQKVVTRRRGGFCYELNSLFGRLLEALGYAVDLLAARVFDEEEVEGPPFDHLALCVRESDGSDPWLCDVGFGDGFREPVRLEHADVQVNADREVRIEPREDGGLVWARQPGGEWKPLYSFGAAPRKLRDFQDMFRYHQTDPQSPFTQRTVCTLATERGRVTLRDHELIETTDGVVRVTTLPAATLPRVLAERFGIQMKS